MGDSESQEEEREVLLSIYDGDPSFKQMGPSTFQYKYGEDGDHKSFLLEITWIETYPTDKPRINMDTFYNKHILPEIKENIVSVITEEAEKNLGTAMTYSLFEFVKEKVEQLMSTQPIQLANSLSDNIEKVVINDDQEIDTPKKEVKKEQLSKAQKRKQWDRMDGKGERARGWDWVDVVKHLSQTGSKQSTLSDSVQSPNF